MQLVFAAKYRLRTFDAQIIDVLRDIFVDVRSAADATLVEMDGEDHHIHLQERMLRAIKQRLPVGPDRIKNGNHQFR